MKAADAFDAVVTKVGLHAEVFTLMYTFMHIVFKIFTLNTNGFVKTS